MDTLRFYQEYWWFLVSLLGALLAFMLFVQGGQSLLYSIGKTESRLDMLLRSLSKKWELTFTTLVTFGGAFFASFPLFYSTSFGGAYWVWMLILFSFVVQAVSYEYISKKGNLLGRNSYRAFLFANGLLGPLLLGAAISTLFTGAEFVVNKENLTETVAFAPIISTWKNPWHGLEALANFWNCAFGIAVFFLARSLACLYFINNIADDEIRADSRRFLCLNAAGFLLFFLPWLVFLLLKSGFAANAADVIVSEEYKYLNNFIALPWTAALLLIGVVLVLTGFATTLFKPNFTKGIWFSGPGTVFAVLAILLAAGLNNTAYYPSTVDMKSSLTLANSSSSLFTLKTMSVVSLFIPFVLAYISYVWRKLDKEKISRESPR
ncbi:MAG: cytochrome d ubiquinol oxidase subunit II [Puniceicoccales bacterium]|jgi:cytochrome d ubiquinol oxidase subunit II|nr:cytochrome d ubiquinol oxidase subunit II [Puniceicoccales bacterium]